MAYTASNGRSGARPIGAQGAGRDTAIMTLRQTHITIKDIMHFISASGISIGVLSCARRLFASCVAGMFTCFRGLHELLGLSGLDVSFERSLGEVVLTTRRPTARQLNAVYGTIDSPMRPNRPRTEPKIYDVS